eukprot:CAMPEP_0203943570 /NCGR_PEP_ID=MMETSP0359-20131031/79513_1 /ASSEMBLY_ACC=CAM_ASM_000338 /TAXON_ID=268821 /ORGANISM="Scrippsiella Hangoei, Strain SHTV-5" /LENGTH=80 /DNA_ID=CAMNT_0050874467 /DNA_START=146 /DNA_END=388 /DNA_ORIENTATION=+
MRTLSAGSTCEQYDAGPGTRRTIIIETIWQTMACRSPCGDRAERLAGDRAERLARDRADHWPADHALRGRQDEDRPGEYS